MMSVLTRFNQSIERLDSMSRSKQRGKGGKADQHPHPNRRWEDRPLDKRSSIEKAMAADNSSAKEDSICAK